MNTTTVKNGKTVKWQLTQDNVGPALAKDLQERGFDGTSWTGVSLPEGRQIVRHATFYRGRDGRFVLVLEV